MEKANKFSLFSTVILLILTVTTKNDAFAWLLVVSSLMLIFTIIKKIIHWKSKGNEQ